MKKMASRSSSLMADLRIVIESPVVGVNYGVQEGKGSTYKVLQLQKSTDQDLVFDIQLPVMLNAEGLPNFGGPLSQGPPAARFVYLTIGKSAGQVNTQWDRRLKVPLGGISYSMIEQLPAEKKHLEARLPGRAKNGEPSCATVQPIDGWKVADR